MVKKVLNTDESIIAEGLAQCLGIWDKMADDEVSVFWAKGRPNVNFNKVTKKDPNGDAYHAVLKVDPFGGNTIKQSWMSNKKINGSYKYTKDIVVSSGMHTGNIGMDKHGDILHLIDPEEQQRAEPSDKDGLGKAF